MRTWQNKRCVLFLSIWKTTSVKTQYCLCQAATCPTWVKVLSFKLLLHKLSFLFIFIFVYNCHCQAVRRSRFVSQGLKKNIKKKVAIVDRSLENHFASVFRGKYCLFLLIFLFKLEMKREKKRLSRIHVKTGRKKLHYDGCSLMSSNEDLN